MTELVAQDGYRSVTVRKLTKLAGVSTGTFYSQFDGTDDCLLTTYAALMDRAWRRLAAARSPDSDRRDQVTRSLRALVSGFASDPGAARLTLVEVFDGGPAALTPVRTHETRLELALKESLDRRGDRISPTAAAWITTGVLHLSRAQLAFGRQSDCFESIESIVGWGRELVVGAAPAPMAISRGSRWLARLSNHRVEPPGVPPADETELIVAAVMKMAAAEGYWPLSESRVSKAAGVPRTHFKRHFADLEDAYLTAVRRISRGLFRHLLETETPPRTRWREALSAGIVRLAEEAASKPTTARLTLTGILEPGLSGLTSRESLISEIATSWLATVPATQRPDPLAAEAAVASLWAAIAGVIDDGDGDRLSATSPTLAHLFLLSVDPAQEGALHAEKLFRPAGDQVPVES